MGAALFALVGLPSLWTSAWASESGKALSYQSGQSDDERDEPYLEERVAELEAQVAELQTAVAELQEDEDEGQADVVEPEPTEIAAVTVAACGRPFFSWGTATSDNVSVHLIQVMDGADADFLVEGAQVYVMEVELLNSRDDALDVDPEDWVVTDCDGTEYTALEQGEGFDPSLAQGSVGRRRGGAGVGHLRAAAGGAGGDVRLPDAEPGAVRGPGELPAGRYERGAGNAGRRVGRGRVLRAGRVGLILDRG